MNTLITGGYGLLGSALHKHFPNAIRYTKQELDITKQTPNIQNIDLVIHCAALKTIACDENPILAMETNIVGTANITKFCYNQNAKLVYISTDYVFKGDKGNYKPNDEVCPQNYYAETKLAGEYVVKSLNNYLIIRLSFYPDIFPYDQAFIDQWTTRITVTDAAQQITNLIQNNATGIQHICGNNQTVYDFAKQTSNGKNIKPISIKDHSFNRPNNTTLSV